MEANSERLVAKNCKHGAVIYLSLVQSPETREEFQLQAVTEETLVHGAVLTPLQSTKAFNSISARIASSKIAPHPGKTNWPLLGWKQRSFNCSHCCCSKKKCTATIYSIKYKEHVPTIFHSVYNHQWLLEWIYLLMSFENKNNHQMWNSCCVN